MIKKGSQVKILRPESYWFQYTGTVVKIEKDIKYPLLIRFDKESYNGVNSNNFSSDEVKAIT
nr:photosystem I reaction center subunit IV [Hypnea sp.]